MHAVADRSCRSIRRSRLLVRSFQRKPKGNRVALLLAHMDPQGFECRICQDGLQTTAAKEVTGVPLVVGTTSRGRTERGVRSKVRMRYD
jgi:hypothetical protein